MDDDRNDDTDDEAVWDEVWTITTPFPVSGVG